MRQHLSQLFFLNEFSTGQHSPSMESDVESLCGVLNSFSASPLERLTISFSFKMRGTDPNMRPLNTHNKMIIGRR